MTTSNVAVVKSQGRGRSNSLPTHVVEYLKTWLMDHMHHPYPTDQEKAEMMLKTGIDVKRLNNWFVNNRIRYWKPRMEALQRQQYQRKQTAISSLPLPGPYTRLVSSSVTDICPAPPLEANLPSPPPTAALHPLVAVSSHQAPATADPTTTTILPTQTSVPSRASPSVVSDTSVYDEGEWSDGGSVKSSSSKRVPSPLAPPLQPQPSTVTPSPKLSRKRVLAAAAIVAEAEKDIALVHQDSWPTKYRRTSEVQWRDACLTFRRVDETIATSNGSQDHDDVTLPTLDEAALLFGFATSQ